MATSITTEDLEQVWQKVAAHRNARATRIGAIFALCIYSGFAILDFLVVPTEQLPWFLAIRAVVAAYGAFLLFIVSRPLFSRYSILLSSLLVVMGGCGIGAMITMLGGFGSPYYAGINLVMVASGLIFLWPKRVVLGVYLIIVFAYLLPNILTDSSAVIARVINNIFFVFGTAIIVSVGQIFSYRTQRTEVLNRYTLERTKQDLEHAHDQLKQLDRFKGQVFANITHELKTPLNMILSPLELILHNEFGRVSEEQRSTFRSMFRSGMKLLKMIMDILDLSKVQDSRIRLKIVENDLVEYLKGLVAQVELLAERKEIKLTFESDVESALVWSDLERLERIFVNLLSNAAKFTPIGGRIKVILTDEADSVLVQVIDNGPGFPPDQAEKVFERFFQSDMGAKRKFGGTGIGLSLAMELVELHAGKIWAESKEDEGATFSVRLFKNREHFNPDVLDRRAMRTDVLKGKREGDRGIVDWSSQLTARDDFRMLDIAEATERRVVDRDLDEDNREYKVLVVDDTPDIIRVVHMALHQHFKVLAAEDGISGFELAVSESPDLIITDLMMPGIDGLELTTKLRDDTKTSHTPIIMLTARSDLDDRVAGIDTGVDTYLTKPFSPRELVSCVRRLLNIQEETADMVMDSKLDSIDTFASGLAHEINNPLNYVKNAILLIRNDTDKVVDLLKGAATRELTDKESSQLEKTGKRMSKMFSTAEAGVKRIAGTVELMRDYAREGLDRKPRPYDVFAAVADVVNLVLPTTGRDVKVETAFEDDGTIMCIAEEFNQVLTNLIQNGIEAVDEGTGRIMVKGRRNNGDVILTVEDNGPGMTPEVRDSIFTAFYSTKGPGHGMGMGLTITRRVLKGLGGKITVESTAGVGTKFTVRVPATSPARELAS